MLDIPYESSAGSSFTWNVKHYFPGKSRKISQYLLFSADSRFNTFVLKRNPTMKYENNYIFKTKIFVYLDCGPQIRVCN